MKSALTLHQKKQRQADNNWRLKIEEPVGGKKKEKIITIKKYDYEDNERNPNDCCSVWERGNHKVQQEGIHHQVQEGHLEVYQQQSGILPVSYGNVCRPEATADLALKVSCGNSHEKAEAPMISGSPLPLVGRCDISSTLRNKDTEN